MDKFVYVLVVWARTPPRVFDNAEDAEQWRKRIIRSKALVYGDPLPYVHKVRVEDHA